MGSRLWGSMGKEKEEDVGRRFTPAMRLTASSARLVETWV